jgi:hypothetical protein
MRSLIFFAVVFAIPAFAEPTGGTMNPKAAVMFISPKDGAKVTSPVKIKMGVSGTKVRPASEDVNDQTTGHHHLIVDAAPIPAGQIIPADEKHIHFGKGQTETELKLSPGSHTLILQFADGLHKSYGPRLSQTIHIFVK